GAEASLAPPEFVARALGGEAVTYERPAIDSDNRPRWLRGRIVPDRKFDGTIKGVYVIAHDISDLKQVQNALAAREGQLRAIMDGVPAPVAYIDREERCHYVNRTFLQYFGLTSEQVSRMRLPDIVGHGIYQSAQAMLTRALQGESAAFEWLGASRRDLTGRRVAEVVGEQRFLQLQPLLDRVLNGEEVSTEELLQQPDGKQRWESIHYAPNRDAEGNVIGIYAVHTDIHEE